MDDYPLLGIFFSMLWFFLFIAWIYLLIALVTDVFRSHDLSGWAKALWTLFIVVLPILGALVYLVARGDDMAERGLADYRRQDEEFRAYVRDAASDYPSGVSTADELTKLAGLRDAGTITSDEFEAQKAKLLA